MTDNHPPKFESSPRPTVATVGTFDGVHGGHLAVLDTVRDLAVRHNYRPLAITFDSHPLETVAPERAPRMLMDNSRRDTLINQSGVDVECRRFDKSLASTSAREWIRLLREEEGVRHLVVGYDNTFGHDGVNMSIADYVAMGREEGIEVSEAPVVPGVSSSAIRRLIAAGEIEKANKMLTRPFELKGEVTRGNALGRTIGFPTANLAIVKCQILPADGVYAASVTIPDYGIVPAMVNIGVRPTVSNDNRRTIEAHLIGWKGNLYGEEITLQFHKRIRDEKHFDSIDALRKQLEADAKEISSYLHT